MIVPIGAWVLGAGVRAAAARRGRPGGAPLTVSINVSARQLAAARLPGARRRAPRATTGSTPTSLCLEVAESALLDDLDATSRRAAALKDLGVQLAIDDFGTGGSSLTYLRRFPFDELKIDRMFVEGLGRDAADDAIVAATIDMAHALDMVVAAEGVETEEQLARLPTSAATARRATSSARPRTLTPRPSRARFEQRPA